MIFMPNMTMSMITSFVFSRSSKEEIRQKLNAIAESTSHEDILSKVEQIHRAYNCWKLLPNTQNTKQIKKQIFITSRINKVF